MQWNRKLINNLNWYIPLSALLLIIIGMIAISSAVEINKVDSSGMIALQRQVVAVMLGIILIIANLFFDYRVFKYYSDIIFLSTAGILVVILVIGRTSSGWINLGLINFQPSELAKIVLILVLAGVIDDNQDELQYLIGFFKPITYALIPFVLVLLQNDLGTSLVFLAILIGMLFAGGANVRFMLLIFGGGLLVIIGFIVCHFCFDTPLFFLKEYQLNRLVVFINPGVDPIGIGYNLIQSKIALGSGQLIGKGLFAGTQNQLHFLPEKHTDFIFSVIGEEFGFLGVVLVILIYLLLLWQMLNVARKARDNYGRLVVIGISSMFFFHIFENIGMTMGLMPITGLPLPFISYGGNSMISSLLAIGLVININIRRKKILF